jgi:hypothetical protein
MSDGTYNKPIRTTHPDKPIDGRVKEYIFQDGPITVPYYIGFDGIPRTLKGETGDAGQDGQNGQDGNDGSIGPIGPTGPAGGVGPAGAMTVEAFISETANITLPNTTSFNQVYTHQVIVTADGDLFVDISLALRPHSTGNDLVFEVDFDGTTIDPSLTEEFKDSGNVQSMWRSQTLDLGFKAAGTYDLELYFRKEATGGTAQLKNYTAKVVRY